MVLVKLHQETPVIKKKTSHKLLKWILKEMLTKNKLGRYGLEIDGAYLRFVDELVFSSKK